MPLEPKNKRLQKGYAVTQNFRPLQAPTIILRIQISSACFTVGRADDEDNFALRYSRRAWARRVAFQSSSEDGIWVYWLSHNHHNAIQIREIQGKEIKNRRDAENEDEPGEESAFLDTGLDLQ